MRRKATVGACILFLLVLVFSAYIFREPILTAAGRLLVVANPVTSADIIVVAVDARKAGILDAADLFHHGVAPQVAVFAIPLDEVANEYIRRGVPFFDTNGWYIKQLRALGVTHVMLIPQEVSGTEDEGNVLSGWLEQHRFRVIILVTSSDHSRRVSRVLHRALKGQSVTLIVRPSRYSKFDPENWWQTRENLKTGIIELQKLIIDFVLHPIS
jgi:hypothetical protein